ncbi:DUF262 domain-containing protein [Streptomyces sp. NPDC048281]|uniref:DUF262 domain-containing protein n=1 Tax=Streptomyces sp. NPDC048281 TaxID=3154715 RepID=UPI0034254E31
MAGVTQPKVSRVALPELVTWAQSGRIRVPQFQRSYRWDAEDAERLFDSVFRGYPIGNLLMWRKPAPAAEISLGELRFKAPERSDALWVVDGQQRLTTLIGALTASEDTVDRRFRIFYDLRDKKFVSATHSKQSADHWLPVWVAGDNRRLLAWQRERNWLTDEDFDLCDAVATAIRTYEIPTYEIEGDDEQALREIFDRMNTFGKTLKRAEIFQALHSAPLDVQPSNLEALRERLRALEFGDFTSQILMQSVMALRGGKVDRDFRQEFKDDEDLHSAFSATEKALRLVVDFLKEDAGIPHLRLLPYALFVPVLARFAHLFGRPTGRAAELLRRWIWRGSAVGAAPQGNTVALRRNASAIENDPVASAARLLELLPPGGDQWQPDLSQTALNRAQAKINVLGLLSAHPVLLNDVPDMEGTLHLRGTRIERTRLLAEVLDSGSSPLSPVVGLSDRSVSNRMVHPGLTGTEAALLPFADPEALRSHCVDDQCMNFLLSGDLDEFLRRRSEVVRQVIAGHVQKMALWGFSDGPAPENLFSEDLWGDPDAA